MHATQNKSFFLRELEERLSIRMQGRRRRNKDVKALAIRDSLLKKACSLEETKELAQNIYFLRFLNGMSWQLHHHYSPQEFSEKPALAEAALDLISREYHELKAFSIPAHDIASYGHYHTSPEVEKIADDTKRLFSAAGEGEKTMSATGLVMARKYATPADALSKWLESLAECRAMFVSEKKRKTAGRSLAHKMFIHNYPLEKAARLLRADLRLPRHLQMVRILSKQRVRREASDDEIRGIVFGREPKHYGVTEREIRSIVLGTNRRRRPLTQAASDYFRQSELPNLEGAELADAFEKLRPVAALLGERFRRPPQMDREDVEQSAILAALQALKWGDRDARKIVEWMVQKVKAEARELPYRQVSLEEKWMQPSQGRGRKGRVTRKKPGRERE